MSSHLHLILSSSSDPLSDTMRDFKKFTSKKIIDELLEGNDSRKEWLLEMFGREADASRRGKYFKVWQDGNHPVLLDTNLMLDRRMNYLHMNPVEQGMIYSEADYVYSSAIDYSEKGKGLLDLELLC